MVRQACSWLFVLLFCILAVTSSAEARQMQGVTFPDSTVISGSTVRLVGIGLRKKLIINVYLGALYLQQRTNNPATIISSDQPKRILLHFLYGEVSADQLKEAWSEGFTGNAPSALKSEAASIATFLGYFTGPVKKGETVVLTYTPGIGTEVAIKGVVKGVIPGKPFMEALWSIWFGPKPPSGDLKEGMTGK